MTETRNNIYKALAPSGTDVVVRMVGTSEGVMFINASVGGHSIISKPGEIIEFALKIAYPAPPYYPSPNVSNNSGGNVIIHQPSHITNTYDLVIDRITITEP